MVSINHIIYLPSMFWIQNPFIQPTSKWISEKWRHYSNGPDARCIVDWEWPQTQNVTKTNAFPSHGGAAFNTPFNGKHLVRVGWARGGRAEVFPVPTLGTVYNCTVHGPNTYVYIYSVAEWDRLKYDAVDNIQLQGYAILMQFPGNLICEVANVFVGLAKSGQ